MQFESTRVYNISFRIRVKILRLFGLAVHYYSTKDVAQNDFK